MYPPERRARGISLVLFGSLAGAILGPFVFSPLFAGKDLDPGELAVPWFAAGGFMLLGLVLVLSVRPDPRRIAELIAEGRDEPAAGPAAPLAEILRRPGAVPALLAALASFGVMVSVMNLTGYIVLGNGHAQHSVFSIVACHFVGMFALVLFAGAWIDRFGHTRAIVGGLGLIAVSVLSLFWVDGIVGTAFALFGLGLGWNFSYVAATTELVGLASVTERGKLLGFSDLLSAFFGASLCLVGGVTFTGAGIGALAVGAAAVALLPVAVLAVRRFRYNPAPAGA
jgi:predicted MFS family arabinose efflux permease